MLNSKRVLAIVTARSGSKGLKEKNLRKLGDKTLIEWAFHSAKRSSYIDEVLLSSDSLLMIESAHNCGVIAPFVRPSELSSDNSSSLDVLKHAISAYGKSDEFDIIVLLQPTSPLRTSRDIDLALEKFINTKVTFLTSICEVKEHPNHMYEIHDGALKPILSRDYKISNRQSFNKVYRTNGAIYIFDKQYLMAIEQIEPSSGSFYEMPHERSIDIDDEFDLCFANTFLKERQ